MPHGHLSEVVCFTVLVVTLVHDLAQAQQPPERFAVYVGTYTGPKSQGIYRFELDLKSGRASEPTLVAETRNPSFLAIHPNRRFLYAVSEVADLNGKKTGGVSAFAIDPASGKLQPLNEQPSEGTGPCYLVVDHSGKNVLVANYGSGSVAVLPIGADGQLRSPSSSIQHKGMGTNPQRQEGPHAHSINVDAANRFAVAADLGLDKLFVYQFDAAQGKLTPNDPPFAKVANGAGPRHFAFHPNGKFAYVINEMHLTVTAFAWDAQRGTLTELQTVTTLPPKTEGEHLSTAEVQVHPSGRFLYGSNRGHDSLAIFRIDPQTGQLTPAGHQPTGGKTPRNFGIDPTGQFLLAANQGSNTLVLFRIHPQTGELQPTGQTVQVPTPVCVKFLPLGG